jgi:hypothetical protein
LSPSPFLVVVAAAAVIVRGPTGLGGWGGRPGDYLEREKWFQISKGENLLYEEKISGKRLFRPVMERFFRLFGIHRPFQFDANLFQS